MVLIWVALMAAPAMATVVATQSGRVQGASADGVLAYKGLPYAAPPVGELRWRAPRAPEPWTGVRRADAYGPACMQTPGAAAREGAGDVGPLSEDCLSLNLWTPAADAGKRPVLVWIHGGGLVLGAGSQSAYDGAPLARRGVVVVTLNYRLGALGFFDHPAFDAGQTRGPVNFGLLDQIAALRWVRDNVAAFGGDPGNVTVLGESAGGMSVLALFASPQARGLFHQGIAQSAPGVPSATRERAREVSANIATAVGLDGARATAAQLRALPAQRLFGLQGQGLSLAPGFVIGDAALPQTILSAFEQRRQARVPLILGNNSDEATVAASFGVDPAKVVQRLGAARIFVKALYPGVSDPAQQGREAVRDLVFTAFARRIAMLHAPVAPTWRYYFSHVQTDLQPQPPGVAHGGEIVYALGTGEVCGCLPVPMSAADRAVSTAMSGYWLAFARNGVPAVAGVPAWPRDTAASPQVLEFAAAPVLRPRFMGARLGTMIVALKNIGRYLDRK
ncbi:carboxylesterase/lipase family protein [Lysobacter silvisoli]|nr:carboxylesterase/lipase family protein [Lysobacter silvisoli]